MSRNDRNAVQPAASEARSSGIGPRTLICARGDHAPLLRHLAHGTISVVGVASPVEADGEMLARCLDSTRVTDIRHHVQTNAPDLVLLCTLAGLDVSSAAAAAALSGATRAILSLEPLRAEAYGMAGEEAPGRGRKRGVPPKSTGTLTQVAPRLRASKGARALADVLDSFGKPASASITVYGRPAHGSLNARLQDALDFLEAFCGEVLTVDAGYAPVAEVAAAAAPTSVSALHGHVTANLRLAGGCVATLAASDAAGSWGRLVTLHGKAGTIEFSDRHFNWWGSDGRVLEWTAFTEFEAPLPALDPITVRGSLFPRAEEEEDSARSSAGRRKKKRSDRSAQPPARESDEPGAKASPDPAEDAGLPVLVRLLSTEIERLFDPAQAALLAAQAPWRNAQRIEAVCETIRLSMQTGQVESAENVARMMEV